MSLSAEHVSEELDKELLDHLTAALRSLFRAFVSVGRYDLFLQVATEELRRPISPINVNVQNNTEENGESEEEFTNDATVVVTPAPRASPRSAHRLRSRSRGKQPTPSSMQQQPETKM